MLQHLMENFKYNGMIDEVDVSEVNEKLRQVCGTLDIYDSNQVLKQSLGATKEEDVPLDVFVRDRAPDIYSTKQHNTVIQILVYYGYFICRMKTSKNFG